MLGKIGDPAAVEPLTRVIGGPGNISEQVLEALVKIPDARSILPLLEVYRINRDAGSNSSFNIRGRLLLINALAEIAGDRDRFLQLTEPERHLVLGEVIEIYSRTELFESAYQIHSLLGKLSGFVETTETERLKIQEIDRQFAKYAEIERNRLPFLP